MEISTIDYRANAEEAIFVHFYDPATGKPLMSGETKVGAWIKGFGARSVQAEIPKARKAMIQPVPTDDPARDALEAQQVSNIATAVALTVSMDGLLIDGNPVGKGDFARVYDLNFYDPYATPGKLSFTQQVIAASRKVESFFTKA
jgi:hypothetical protein